MPRNTYGEFYFSPGTAAVSGEPATASQVNDRFDDVKEEANSARPISAGGTGATNAAAARSALGALPTSGGDLTGGLGVRGNVTLTAPSGVSNAHVMFNDAGGALSGLLAYDQSSDTMTLRWQDGAESRTLTMGLDLLTYAGKPIVHAGVLHAAVGQYCFMSSTVTAAFGTVISGTNLSPAGVGNSINPVSPQPGTWRCLGYATPGGITLFQRIS